MNIEQSEQINELAAALAKVQGTLEAAHKNGLNPHFKSKFADLRAIWQACREPLVKNGLAITQAPVTHTDNGNTFVGVTTEVMHTSGQWQRSTLLLKPVKVDPQAMGSAITYARRYALAAVVGIYQEDDDAESATDHSGKAPRKTTPKKPDKVEKFVESVGGEVVDEKADTEKAYGNSMYKRLQELKTKQALDDWLNVVNAKHEEGTLTEATYQKLKGYWHERMAALEE